VIYGRRKDNPATIGVLVAVFYSFHYDRDAARVQQVMNMGLVEGQRLLNPQDWEAVRKRGKSAIQEWIDEQMKYKTAVIVLVGAETAKRPWVDYEIRKAWSDKRGLAGIRINGLAPFSLGQDPAGTDPFAKIPLKGGGTLANYVALHTPAGSTGKEVYASISANLKTWVDGAYKPS